MAEATPASPHTLAVMRLLQLASPSLPVGGFTYSQGLEWACEAGWVTDVTSFEAWQLLQLEEVLLGLDLPILLRLFKAASQEQLEVFRHWVEVLLAQRETNEARREERQRGQAFMRVLGGLELAPQEACWQSVMRESQLAGLAFAGWQWQLSGQDLLHCWAYSWLENAVMAGVKLVPFGQQAAQSLLARMSTELSERLAPVWQVGDDDIGGSLPLVAISSACHETQHTRLFRS